MATRDVSAQLNRPNGAPWLGAKVRFRPLDDSYLLSPDESYPISTVVATTDVNGEFTVTLAAGLSVAYEVTMPDEETFRIIVSEGAATTLELLRAAYDVSVPPPPPDLETVVTEIIETSETFEAMLEDIVIANVPAGPTGPTGPQGPQGIQGAIGPTGPAGTGDVVGPAAAVDGEIALFDGVSGKLIKRATGTGVARVDSGVLSVDSDVTDLVSAASDTVAGKVELATTAETTTGSDATRAVTPDGLHDMTSLAGAAWFLDEDMMSSDSATKVPSQQSVKAYVDANAGGDSGPLYLNSSISTAISATAAESLFDRNVSLPGGTLAVGDELRITAWGETANSSGGTLTFQPRLRIGGVAGVLVATGEVDGLVTGATDTWVIAQTLRVTAIGASGSLYAQMGSYFSATKATVAAGPLTRTAPPAAVPSVVNTTTAQVIGATIQHSSAAAGMVSTLHGLTVELLRV